ncbi:diaminobutyrate-2-oxoglutarate transaminase [Natronocella acetinitrilica]|uniref:Diaminobutyrate--2-oxoglutarate transaminase n=1 Tax=Natronocella acetinitrilica TaxID=414046 RepID=A0AAE3G351_9GAMM|nr:diaminobutyrate--2-oxoglutarate transaminase [Natronocella acetinitrilica]MCP1674950.1 diaminobutyrate-2-oxoglutarate transaminase [Natronocella acetinitrilica]
MDLMKAITDHESVVRSYVRNFPAVFEKARGSWLYDVDGNAYLDFFAGASVLNYGHNHPELKEALLDYISGDNITHSLDMASVARAEFLEAFDRLILQPRGMNYKVQFPGPAGNNAVEAALKIARKVKGREKIMSFTNAFHGMTLGALSITGNSFKRQGAGLPLTHSDSMPYSNYFGPEHNTIEYIDRMLQDSGSGMDLPAAAVVETVQAEGGVNVAADEWLRGLQDICRKYDIMLIVDDIQTGNGRCGKFFSFEEAGIDPDVVTVSKSISGYGLPLALTLLKPEHDIWEPGEHNGTFRGHNLAFVTARRTLELFWADDTLEQDIARRSSMIEKRLLEMVRKYPEAEGTPRGRGMMQAIEFGNKELAGKTSAVAFKKRLIIETAGPDDEVLKLLPPLTTSDEDLVKGLDIIEDSLVEAMRELGITKKAASE